MDYLKYLPVIVSTISLLLSLLTIVLTKKYNSSDYKLSEKVKDDTLELLSALRALQYKYIQTTQGMKGLDIFKEKEIINSFLHKPTSFAYSIWMGKKGLKAGEKPEEWRILYLQLIQLLSTESITTAGEIALDLEDIFNSLGEKDFKAISSYLLDIPAALKIYRHMKDGDIVIKAFSDIIKDKKKLAHKKFLESLLFLKGKGISDPNIDLFLGVINNDVTLFEKAIKNGADLTMTELTLLNKYEQILQELNRPN